jgi:histidyl-tRNA synthetase
MNIEKRINQLGFPYRFHQEIAQRREVQKIFNQLCMSYGSLEIETPFVEPLNSVIGTAPRPLREIHLNKVFHGLVFFENKSFTCAVRYEASGPIAEIVASHRWEEKKDLSFHYMQEMVRLENSEEISPTRQRAFFQMGHERFTLHTDKNIKNLAEEIAMILSFFNDLNLKGVIRISHAEIPQYGLGSPEIDFASRRRLISLFEKGSFDEAYRVVSTMALSQKLKYFLTRILTQRNLPLVESLNFLNEIPELQQATQEIQTMIQTLDDLKVSRNKILFDGGIHRSLGFYSGIVFQADVENVPEVAGGGDFSAVMNAFENPQFVQCSGFAIGYERIAVSLSETLKADMKENSYVSV